ncbi:hypothetical protein RHOER0001_1147 [Rhodococcus erythropolis SK121]|nr:hypothetical protein RHOER0001_1147 [Rhodococcus erythropolis SK121]
MDITGTVAAPAPLAQPRRFETRIIQVIRCHFWTTRST